MPEKKTTRTPKYNPFAETSETTEETPNAAFNAAIQMAQSAAGVLPPSAEAPEQPPSAQSVAGEEHIVSPTEVTSSSTTDGTDQVETPTDAKGISTQPEQIVSPPGKTEKLKLTKMSYYLTDDEILALKQIDIMVWQRRQAGIEQAPPKTQPHQRDNTYSQYVREAIQLRYQQELVRHQELMQADQQQKSDK